MCPRLIGWELFIWTLLITLSSRWRFCLCGRSWQALGFSTGAKLFRLYVPTSLLLASRDFGLRGAMLAQLSELISL